MDKRIVLAGIACCALGAAIAAVKKSAQAGPKPEVWDKMRAKMEEMPEDFPPRVMYDNIETTRSADGAGRRVRCVNGQLAPASSGSTSV